MNAAQIDHVVFAGPDLAVAIDHVEAATGVRAAPGGRHPSGTANALIAFTRGGVRVRQYLEIIGPDAEAGYSAADIDTFGINRLDAPRVVTFAVRPSDIAAAVLAARAARTPFGDVTPLSRTTPDGRELAWRLARPVDPGAHPPFFIDWGQTAHPALERIPTLELSAFRRRSTDPVAETARLQAVGVTVGDPGADIDAVEVIEGADGFAVEVDVDGRLVSL